MQTNVPVAPVMPITASPSNGKPLPALTGFGDELTKLLAAIAPVRNTALAMTPEAGTAAQSTTASGSSPASAISLQLPPCPAAATLAPAGIQTPVPKPMPLMPADTATARFRPTATMRRGTETAHSDMMAGADALGQVIPPQVPIPAADPPRPAASAPQNVEDPLSQPALASGLSTLPEHSPALPPDVLQSAIPLEAAVDHDARLEPATAPAATVNPTPLPSATTTVSTRASSAPPPATSHPSPAAQIAATLVSMRHAPNAQRPVMKLQSPETEQMQTYIDRATDVAPARAAITVERREPPCLLATTPASSGVHAPVLETPLPVTADAVIEPKNAQPSPDQAAVAQMPLPPSVIGAPDVESRKTYSASDAAAVRLRRAASMRSDIGNNATAGTDPTTGAGDKQPVLAPITVPIHTADPQPAQRATSAPGPQTTTPTATPGSNVAKQPLASPPDTSEPATFGGGAAPMRREAANSDAKPEQITAPAASMAPTPLVPATTSMQTPTISAATSGTPHPSPAALITPALVSMSHAPDGAQRLTMKLEPPELGQVQIRIDRPADNAPAHIAITVERPETLQLLLRDQPQLQRALDLAGVPAEGRSISFHVATPEPAGRNETAFAPAPTGSASAMSSGDLSYGASRQWGQPAQPEPQQIPSGIVDDNEPVEAIPITPMRWLRAGLDITA